MCAREVIFVSSFSTSESSSNVPKQAGKFAAPQRQIVKSTNQNTRSFGFHEQQPLEIQNRQLFLFRLSDLNCSNRIQQTFSSGSPRSDNNLNPKPTTTMSAQKKNLSANDKKGGSAAGRKAKRCGRRSAASAIAVEWYIK